MNSGPLELFLSNGSGLINFGRDRRGWESAQPFGVLADRGLRLR